MSEDEVKKAINTLVALEGKKIVSITFEGQTYGIELTDQALDDIRFKFNPSNLDKVAKLKLLAATYLSLISHYANENPIAGREFAIARTDMQKVSMCAVLAATKGL